MKSTKHFASNNKMFTFVHTNNKKKKTQSQEEKKKRRRRLFKFFVLIQWRIMWYIDVSIQNKVISVSTKIFEVCATYIAIYSKIQTKLQLMLLLGSVYSLPTIWKQRTINVLNFIVFLLLLLGVCNTVLFSIRQFASALK